MRTMGRRAATLAAAAVAGALALGGCGDDDDDGKGGAATTSAPVSQDVVIRVSEKGKKGRYAAPAQLDAGMARISLENEGDSAHEAQLIRVDGDRTAKEVLAVVNDDSGRIPAWVHAAGGPGTTAPGARSTVTAVLQPGLHYVVDSSDSDAEAKPVSFEVRGEPGEPQLPGVPATITAEEYSFTTSGLKAGLNQVRFENTGRELHHALAFPLVKGATFEQAKAFFQTEGEPEGKPPVDFAGGTGTTVIDPGTAQVVELDLEAGTYALVCFITNRSGGPPHAAMGMVTELEVAKPR